MNKTNFLSTSYIDIKNDLKTLLQSYFHDTFNNFSDDSVGMMYINTTASIGELLTYYINSAFNESSISTSNEITNVYKLAQTMGYKPIINSPSSVVIKISLIIDKDTKTTVFDAWKSNNRDEPILTLDGNKIKFTSTDNVVFRTEEIINFTQNNSELIEDDDNFILSRYISLYNLDIETDSVEMPTIPIKYWSFDLEDKKLVGIKKIYIATEETTSPDEDNIFYEVNSLAEKYVNVRDEFSGKLKSLKINNKFVTSVIDKNIIRTTFGTGTIDDIDYDENYLQSEDSKYGNPSTFLYSKSYGTTPIKTGNNKLFVEYYISNGKNSNVLSNTITTLSVTYGNPILYTTTGFDYLSLSDFEVNNEKPSYGGSDGETINEIKNNTLKQLSSQNRMITIQDFETKVLSFPNKYGKISKVYVEKNIEKSQNVDIYTLSSNINGFTNVSDDTKSNLKVHLDKYRMLTDTINIMDTFIINIEVLFNITTNDELNNNVVILNCINEINDYFQNNIDINSPIYINNVVNKLLSVNGVKSVNELEFKNIHIEDDGDGHTYSKVGYDLASATIDNIIYPPKDIAIFEIKYKDINIKGSVRNV